MGTVSGWRYRQRFRHIYIYIYRYVARERENLIVDRPFSVPPDIKHSHGQFSSRIRIGYRIDYVSGVVPRFLFRIFNA